MVVVGDRQKGREHGNNVMFSDYDRQQIAEKIKIQTAHGRYESDKRFGNGDAGKRIAGELASIKLDLSKDNSI